MEHKYPVFPLFPERHPLQTQDRTAPKSKPARHPATSLLVHAPPGSKGVDLYLDGNCCIGHILLGYEVLSCHTIPQTSTSLAVLCKADKELLYQHIELDLPSRNAQMVVTAATELHQCLSHIHEAIAEPLALFRDAMDVASKWHNKVNVTAESHDSALVRTQ